MVFGGLCIYLKGVKALMITDGWHLAFHDSRQTNHQFKICPSSSRDFILNTVVPQPRCSLE